MILLSSKITEAKPLHDKAQAGVKGHFIFQAIKRGQVVRETEFDNLITDYGIDNWPQNRCNVTFAYCRVGTGTNVPAFTDTTLGAQISSTNTLTAVGAAGLAPDYEATATLSYNWAVGEVVGNLTEVGVGKSASAADLFSRALILDGSGNPTSFPVEADEQLRVTYIFKLYPPLADVATTQVIGGTMYDVIIRGRTINSTNYWKAYDGFMTPCETFNALNAYSGDMVSNTSGSNPIGVLGSLSASMQPYVSGTYKRGVSFTGGPTTANGNIKTTISFHSNCAFQYGYTPAIVKPDTHTIIIPLEINWNRL